MDIDRRWEQLNANIKCRARIGLGLRTVFRRAGTMNRVDEDTANRVIEPGSDGSMPSVISGAILCARSSITGSP